MTNLPASTPIQIFAYEGSQFDLVAGAEHAVRRVDERVLGIERWGTFVEPEFLRLLSSVTDAAFLRHSRDGLLNALRPNSLFGAGGVEASIRLNDQWRLILRFETNDAGRLVVIVEIVDYH